MAIRNRLIVIGALALAFGFCIHFAAGQSGAASQADARIDAILSAALQANGGLSIRKLDFDMTTAFLTPSPSPDGRYFALADGGDLAVRDLITGTSRKVTHRDANNEERASSGTFYWASDGKKLAYLWLTGPYELRVIGFDGSGQRTVLTGKTAASLRLNGWFPDGKSVLCILSDEAGNTRSLTRVSVEDGSIQKIKPDVKTGTYMLSPDGRYVACEISDDNRNITLSILPVSGGPGVDLFSERYLTLAGWDLDGKSILFASDRTGSVDLWRIAINQGKPQGDAELVKSKVGLLYPLGITRRGFYYSSSGSGSDLNIGTLDRVTGAVTTIEKTINRNHIGSASSPAWSPDGNQLAYLAATRETEQFEYSTLCIRSQQDRSQKEFVLPVMLSRAPRWSADAKFLYGVESGGNGSGSKLIRINASTGETGVAATIQGATISEWTRDANTLMIRRNEPTAAILLAHDVASGRETELYRAKFAGPGTAPTPMFLAIVSLSPDFKWILVIDRSEAGKPKLIIVPTAGGEARVIYAPPAAPGGLALAIWTPDSNFILCPTRDALLEIPITGGTPRKLEQAQPSSIRRQFYFHPDGKHVAFLSEFQGDGGVWLMENLPPLKGSK